MRYSTWLLVGLNDNTKHLAFSTGNNGRCVVVLLLFPALLHFRSCSIRDGNGRTALHFAATGGSVEVVDAILNSKPFQDDEIAFAHEIAGSLQLTARKHTECLGSLVRSKNRVFAPLFRELAQAAESKEQLRLAVAGVQLTCPPTEFQDLLESAFANSKHASVIYNLHKS